jgi:DNA-3-methyladenine glycosylase I
MQRCTWASREPLLTYHDLEWGVPVHDDRLLFEALVLQGAQAGLSWETILRKRDAYRAAFDAFDPRVVAAYDRAKIEALLVNPGIVRNRRKVESAVRNAAAVLALQVEFGTFDAYLWRSAGGRRQRNAWQTMAEIPQQTAASLELSRDLARRGLTFVGPTICYALMQAVGLVNDHLVTCPRWAELSR